MNPERNACPFSTSTSSASHSETYTASYGSSNITSGTPANPSTTYNYNNQFTDTSTTQYLYSNYNSLAQNPSLTITSDYFSDTDSTSFTYDNSGGWSNSGIGTSVTSSGYVTATLSDHYSYTNSTSTSYQATFTSMVPTLSNGIMTVQTITTTNRSSYTWSSKGPSDSLDISTGSIDDPSNTQTKNNTDTITWTNLALSNGAGSSTSTEATSWWSDSESGTQEESGTDSGNTGSNWVTTVTELPNGSTTTTPGSSSNPYSYTMSSDPSSFGNLNDTATPGEGSPGLVETFFQTGIDNLHEWEDAFPALINAVNEGDVMKVIDAGSTIFFGAGTRKAVTALVQEPVNEAVALVNLGNSIDQNWSEKQAKEKAYNNIEYVNSLNFDPEKLKPRLNEGVVNGLSAALSWTAQFTGFGAGGFEMVTLHAPVSFHSKLDATLAAKKFESSNWTQQLEGYVERRQELHLLNCFPAGTPVATVDGPRPIESIRPGDQVWAYDLVASDWRPCLVLQSFVNHYTGHSTFVTVAGETVESTYLHPFWVVRGEGLADRPRRPHLDCVPDSATTPGRWVDAADLQVGDELLLLDGRFASIEEIRHCPYADKVYNLEVASLHCYAVGVHGLLVHNGNGRETGRSFSRDEQRIADYIKQETGLEATPNPLEGAAGAGRQGDAIIADAKHEFKTLDPGATAKTIKNTVNNSIRKGGQARNIVIDARGSGLTQEVAAHGIRMALGISRGRIDNITVIGDDFFINGAIK